MSIKETNNEKKPVGWHKNDEGVLQYWDGDEWGPTAPFQLDAEDPENPVKEEVTAVIEEVKETEELPESSTINEFFEPVGKVNGEVVYRRVSNTDEKLEEVSFDTSVNPVAALKEEKNDESLGVYQWLTIILLALLAVIALPFLLSGVLVILDAVMTIFQSILDGFSKFLGNSWGSGPWR